MPNLATLLELRPAHARLDRVVIASYGWEDTGTLSSGLLTLTSNAKGLFPGRLRRFGLTAFCPKPLVQRSPACPHAGSAITLC
jgi:hypothetical protein